MRKSFVLLSVLLLFSCPVLCGAQQQNVLVLDEFEGEIVSDPKGTIDAGAGNGSSIQVSADQDVKHGGEQSLKIVYNAVSGGYMWVARGYNLDVKGAAQWNILPKDVDWPKYKAITFYMNGSNSGANIAFDIKDSGKEMFRFMIKDDFTGWKKIVCSFDQFFPRGDWQPSDADVNGVLDFPIMSFQFEPIAIKNGSFNIDDVSLES